MRTSTCSWLWVLLLLTASAPASERRQIFPAGARPVGPYSPGILAGDMLYVSGQGAKDSEGKLPEGIEAQTRQCLENVKAIVEGAGLSLDHVVFAHIYLSRMEDFAAVNKVYSTYFHEPRPARATIAVTSMPNGTPVEISAVAVRDKSAREAIAGTAVGAYSPAIRTADRIYVSGVLGRDASGVESALQGVEKTLRSAGADLGQVVQLLIYTTPDVADSAVDTVLGRYFEKGNAPARVRVTVPALATGATVEIAAIAVRERAQRRVIRPRSMPAQAAWSPCVLAGNTLYCSAQSSLHASTVGDQVHQAMHLLLDCLAEAGMDFSQVVASNVYLDSIDEFVLMNQVYGSYFAPPPPTRTTVQPMPAARSRLARIAVVAVR